MNLKSTLYNLLSIKPVEANRVFLLLGMGFFMGIFLATLEVGTASLFLNNLNENKQLLPLAILSSGALGIGTTAIYNFFQSRISFNTLAYWSLSIITLLLIGVEVLFRTLDNPLPVYFFAFTFRVPANFIVILIFWGAFGRMFDLRQSKRIIGSIDTGQLVASIIALFSIPVLSNILETQQLLLISLWSIIGYLISFVFISRKKLFIQGSDHKEEKSLSYTKLLKNKYMVLMSIFVVISMISIKFVDYSFLSVTSIQFDEKNLTNFLSYFEAAVVIFSFLFQTFVTDKIIALYGLKVALIINPILIALFTALAIPIGYIFGFSDQAESFIYFFIIISMSKLFSASLKDALDGPAFKLYFLPVDQDVKFDVQTKVEGVISAFAYLIAGGLIILINNFQIFSLITISIFTLPAILLWYLTTTKMHRNYRHTLQNMLRRNKKKNESKTKKEYAVNKVLENEVNSESDQKVLLSLMLMEKIEPALFESTVFKLAESDSEKVNIYAKDQVQRLDKLVDDKNEVSKLSQLAVNLSNQEEVLSLTHEQLLKLSKSNKADDRVLAAKLLTRLISDQNIFILLELLRDMDSDVKMEAIITARKVKRKETWSVLIGLLNSPTYSNASVCALREVGEEVLPTLETAFHKSGQDDNTMYKIVKTMGRIGGEKVMSLLWNKIEFPDRRILQQILFSFRYCDYRAKESEITQLTTLIENEISKSIWNLAALTELPDVPHFKFLRKALKEEIADNHDNIFILLSIIHDPQSVQLVRDNVESGSSEGIAFAIELLDLFIAPDLKPMLFPLLDDISVSEKVKQLQIHFPRDSYTEVEVLNFLLNRNFNLTNRWTKACALHVLAFLPEFKISRELVAQLFNNDYLIREAAAWVIYHKDNSAFDKISERLKKDIRVRLQDSIEKNKLEEGLDDGFFLTIEIVMFLRKVALFKNIKGLILCDLADKIEVTILSDGAQLRLDTFKNSENLYIVGDGQIVVKSVDGHEVSRHSTTETFGSIAKHIPKNAYLEAQGRSLIFTLSINDFYNIMSDHHELAQNIIENLTQLIETETVV